LNWPLLRYTLRANVIKLVVIAAGLVLMGVIMPVMYAAFGQEMGEFIESVPFFANLASSFGGGDIMSLTGSMSMAFTHPFTLLLMGIMAIVFPALAIAGEREKGTLEITLSRPISRRGLLLTLFVAGLLFLGCLMGVLVITTGVTTYAVGFGDEVPLSNMVQLWLVSTLLFVAFMALAFAASVESDRAGPAIGIPAIFVLLNYLAYAIGSIWPDVGFLEDWSMFSLLKARQVLNVGAQPGDYAVLTLFTLACLGFALYRFPRRDLPAPA
jgi:ABC-2 type transport system permease protein